MIYGSTGLAVVLWHCLGSAKSATGNSEPVLTVPSEMMVYFDVLGTATLSYTATCWKELIDLIA